MNEREILLEGGEEFLCEGREEFLSEGSSSLQDFLKEKTGFCVCVEEKILCLKRRKRRGMICMGNIVKISRSTSGTCGQHSLIQLN